MDRLDGNKIYSTLGNLSTVSKIQKGAKMKEFIKKLFKKKEVKVGDKAYFLTKLNGAWAVEEDTVTSIKTNTTADGTVRYFNDKEVGVYAFADYDEAMDSVG